MLRDDKLHYLHDIANNSLHLLSQFRTLIFSLVADLIARFSFELAFLFFD